MISRLKLLMISVLSFGFLMAPVGVVGTVFAQGADIDGKLCEGADLQFGSQQGCQTEEGSAEDKVNDLITDVVNIFSVIVGVVAVIMIIIGGFRYITSGGDSGNVTGAKNTILYALIGLIIVALAQFIVKFVLTKATGLGDQ